MIRTCWLAAGLVVLLVGNELVRPWYPSPQPMCGTPQLQWDTFLFFAVFVVSLALGVSAACVYSSNHPAYRRCFARSGKSVAGVLLLCLLAAWTFRNPAPRMNGEPAYVQVELRVPETWSGNLDYLVLKTHLSMRADAYPQWVDTDGLFASVADYQASTPSASRTLSAGLLLETATDSRRVAVLRLDEPYAQDTPELKLPVPARPSERDTAWSAWQPVQAKGRFLRGFHYRFRVQSASAWRSDGAKISAAYWTALRKRMEKKAAEGKPAFTEQDGLY